MMRKLIMAGIAALTVAISSCDDETKTLGYSLTDNVDRFSIVTDSFDVSTRSMKVDSVLSRGNYSYLGRLKDPETGSYITCDYMTQFSLLEKESNKIFPNRDSILGRDANGLPQADSCFVTIMVNRLQGDSLAAMRLTLCELNEPVTRDRTYYTNFDPEEQGYLRQGDGAVRQNMVYSISDLTQSDSLRNKLRTSDFYQYIGVGLNQPYTDKAGKTYNNYGTYIMQKYYNEPTLFKNANTFTRNVCPGFYIKSTDGHGAMAEIAYTQLVIYFHYTANGKTVVTSCAFNSTQEVLQTTHIVNDQQNIQKLVNIDTCTYLKAPAGIYTEVTLPIEEIKMRKDADGFTHENDTITSAKVVFRRMRNTNSLTEGLLEEPTNLLLVERDSIYSFFENNEVPDNLKSYLATYSSSQKTYSFNNISSLVNRMWARRNSGNPNWNKAVLIPVQVTSSASSTTTTVANVSNEMNVNSVRLVGGTNNRHAPVRISVIYNRNR